MSNEKTSSDVAIQNTKPISNKAKNHDALSAENYMNEYILMLQSFLSYYYL